MDGSGHLDAEELSRMMTDLLMPSSSQESVDSKACAASVVKHLDKDGNGMLEEDEFFSWVSNGMKMSLSDRKQLKSEGGSKSILVQFLEGIEKMIDAREN